MTSPAGPTSNAEIFFESLFAGTDAYTQLQDLITKGADENAWREFKEASWFDATAPKDEAERKSREGKVKAIWSESLSAFANSGGGVLIWGIRAPERLATAASLSQNAEALADRLRGWVINAVEPPVLGVEIRQVLMPGSTRGFVVCLIPPSAFMPHCGSWVIGGYYVRGQDSNVQMRPEVLRRMFYPQIGPRLIPVVRLTLSKGDNRSIYAAMSVNIRNGGSGSANGVFVDLHARGFGLFYRYPNSDLWKRRSHKEDSGIDSLRPIHPSENVVLLNNLSANGAPESSDPLNYPIEVVFWIFAEHAEAIRAEVRFEPDEIKQAFDSKTPIHREGKIVPFQR